MPTDQASGQPASDAESFLTVPRSYLKQRLAKQIERGLELANREIKSVEALDEFREYYRIWDDDNASLIKRSYTTDEQYKKYIHKPLGSALRRKPPDQKQPPDQRLRERLKTDIFRLQSLQRRLPLYAEISSANAPVSQAIDDSSISKVQPAIFLVHGRDEGTKHGVARFVRTITGLEPIILAEQPALGQTVIESFERYAAQVSYAIVLATGDDEGRLIGEELLKPRARQNVILELGWFAGKLGRQKVALLYKRGVELPSDMGGVLYVELDEGEGWKLRLAREMRAAGLSVDMNKV